MESKSLFTANKPRINTTHRSRSTTVCSSIPLCKVGKMAVKLWHLILLFALSDITFAKGHDPWMKPRNYIVSEFYNCQNYICYIKFDHQNLKNIVHDKKIHDLNN